MLAQSELIDALKDRIATLEAELAEKTIRIERSGSLAEASLAVTGILEEAQRAADIYLYNIRKKAEEAGKK